MSQDTNELLIGSTAILLLGLAIIAFPGFSNVVDGYVFSYLRHAVHFLN
jgi:hypothetical protein